MQVPLAGIDAAESDTLPPPLAAVTVPPGHVVAPEAGFAFTRPNGYVSRNAAPVRATALVLPSVIVRTDVPLVPIAAGANAFVIVGWLRTVSVALAAVAVPAFAEATGPVEFR